MKECLRKGDREGLCRGLKGLGRLEYVLTSTSSRVTLSHKARKNEAAILQDEITRHGNDVEGLKWLAATIIRDTRGRGLYWNSDPTALYELARKRAPGDAEFQSLFEAPNVLYVLPKRRGEPANDRPAWLRRVDWVGRGEVERVLHAVHSDGRIERPDGAVNWTTNRLGPIPEIDRPQLIAGGGSLRPIVGGGGGILVGEARRGGRRIWVLSDPDILANHGLARGDNAAFAVALIDALRSPGGTVVFDETHHGFIQRPSLWRSASRLPFAIVSIQALIALAVRTSRARRR